MHKENSKPCTLLASLCMWAENAYNRTDPAFQEETLTSLERSYLMSEFSSEVHNRVEAILFVEQQKELLQILQQFDQATFKELKNKILKPLCNEHHVS